MDTVWRTRGRTAPAEAVPGGDHLSRWTGCTSRGTPPRSGGALSGACAWGSTPPGSGRRTPGVGMAGAALRPRAITSGQNKKRPSHDTLSGRHWLRRWSHGTLAQALRYSQCSPAHSVCIFWAGFGRWCPAGSSAACLCRIPGRAPIHPLRQVYHNKALIANLFAPFFHPLLNY